MDRDFEKRLRAIQISPRYVADVLTVYAKTHGDERVKDITVLDVFEDPWSKNLVATVYSPDFPATRKEGEQLELLFSIPGSKWES